ncbi:hypothetical protein FWG95_02555 [Candidatus Saccharibacteria bacterium]|nr:hypothetical protein [Candidatus Saccharibacteria bacterium]
MNDEQSKGPVQQPAVTVDNDQSQEGRGGVIKETHELPAKNAFNVPPPMPVEKPTASQETTEDKLD